jgi:transposase
MKLRDQLSLSEIAKRTGLSRNTVKKWLKAPSEAVPKYERSSVEGKLTAFEPILHQALTTDSHRPKQGRRSGRALFAQIQAQGYRGGYSAVTDYIRRWRVKSMASPTKAFVPLSFELGEAFQFDWSDEAMVVGGVFYNVQVAHLKLCASRAFWLVAYPSQGHEMLFDAHTRSFQALGGVTRRGIYDNMRTAIDKVGRGKERQVNARFAAMVSHFLFEAAFCNPASGWEKGQIEKNVQDARHRLWQPIPSFPSLAALNDWLEARCRELWTEIGHSALPGTIAEAKSRGGLARGGSATDAASAAIRRLRRTHQAGHADVPDPSGPQSLQRAGLLRQSPRQRAGLPRARRRRRRGADRVRALPRLRPVA